MRKFGIDISKWQGDFNFDKAIAEGVEFAIIKGGGGDDGRYKDAKFERNYNEAKSKKLPVGCYWFSRALSVAEAEAEAQYFYDAVLLGKQFELPIYMDVEHKDMLNLGKDALTKIIIAFCEKLEKLGYFVGVYSSKYYFERYIDDSKIQRFAHWVAEWTKQPTYKGDDSVFGMWQFGGETNLIRTNKVAGVTCDQNYMLIDYPSIIKTYNLNGFMRNKEEVSKAKSVDVLANEVILGLWGNGNERKNRLESSGYNYDAVQNCVDKLLSKKIKIGDEVKLSKDATIYGTNQKFDTFVYDSTLYLRELNGERAVVSTVIEGAVTGAVDVKHLIKV